MYRNIIIYISQQLAHTSVDSRLLHIIAFCFGVDTHNTYRYRSIKVSIIFTLVKALRNTVLILVPSLR